MRRTATTTLLGLLALFGMAAPALAHASFDVQRLTPGQEQALVLRVPVEREAGNQRIDVLVPAGFTVTDCAAADGWACRQEPGGDDATVVVLEREDDGAGSTERFGLTLAAPQREGVHLLPVVQVYDDGEEAPWTGDADSDRPAPRLQVGDATEVVEPGGTSPPEGTSTPAAASEAPTTAASPTPQVAPSDPATTPAGPVDGDGGVPAPLLVALAALAGVGAVVLVRRRAT